MVDRPAEQLPIKEVAKPTTIHYHFQPGHKLTEVSNITSPPALPIFNGDKEFFTPAFILNIDQNYYRLNIVFEGQKFEQRVKESKQQLSKQNLNLARPSSDFCQICRTTFINYHEHCELESHLNNVKAAKGNLYISELCQEVSQATQNKEIKLTDQRLPKKSLHTAKVKKKEKQKRGCNKNNIFSREGSASWMRLLLTTQVSFERE